MEQDDLVVEIGAALKKQDILHLLSLYQEYLSSIHFGPREGAMSNAVSESCEKIELMLKGLKKGTAKKEDLDGVLDACRALVLAYAPEKGFQKLKTLLKAKNPLEFLTRFEADSQKILSELTSELKKDRKMAESVLSQLSSNTKKAFLDFLNKGPTQEAGASFAGAMAFPSFSVENPARALEGLGFAIAGGVLILKIQEKVASGKMTDKAKINSSRAIALGMVLFGLYETLTAI